MCLIHATYGQKNNLTCPGRFRWDVKTLTDSAAKSLLFSEVFPASIDELVKAKPEIRMCILSKKHNHLPRFRDERRLVRIIVQVTDYNIQRDQDYHILIRSADGKYRMVAEIPNPDCEIFVPFPYLRNAFKKARDEFDSVRTVLDGTGEPVLVEITGVPFWDAPHWWLRGTASNGREIHPVLSVKILGR